MGITELSNEIKNVFTVGDRTKRNIFYSINILVYVLFIDNNCYQDKCYSTVFNFNDLTLQHWVILCLVWHAFGTKLQKRNSKVLRVFVTVFQAKIKLSEIQFIRNFAHLKFVWSHQKLDKLGFCEVLPVNDLV